MELTFLPREIYSAVRNLSFNNLTELRLREGQPVSVEYAGAYSYLGPGGVCRLKSGAIICRGVPEILSNAMGGCVYSYAEQLKEGFITPEGGIRIGVAGEYITQNGRIKTIARPTSLNIRIPHCVTGCSQKIFRLLSDGLKSTLIFSRPGCGKTTILRDLARTISKSMKLNVLVMDVRSEISGAGTYDLGESTDVVRCGDKLAALESALRAMKPDVIITDELYGDGDFAAVKFARDCGMCVIASSHLCDRQALVRLPFDYFVKLGAIAAEPEIYDKNFNLVCDNRAYDVCGSAGFGG